MVFSLNFCPPRGTDVSSDKSVVVVLFVSYVSFTSREKQSGFVCQHWWCVQPVPPPAVNHGKYTYIPFNYVVIKIKLYLFFLTDFLSCGDLIHYYLFIFFVDYIKRCSCLNLNINPTKLRIYSVIKCHSTFIYQFTVIRNQ